MINKDHNKLLLDIQKRFGNSISKVSHLKLLQERIEFTTNKRIGFNTLRRIFGYLDYTSPNINTLNTLSQYLGYSSFGIYQKNELKDYERSVWERIVKIETANTIAFPDILWLATQVNTFDYHIKILSIIKSLLYRKEYALLNYFFDYRIFIFEEVNRLKIASNVCIILRTLDSKSINKIIKTVGPNIVFRENILHWFIDYSHLNGYYGAFLRNTTRFVDKEHHEALFGDLMINYTAYLSGKTTLKNIPLDRIKDDFFIVLRGRAYAYNLIYFAEQKNTIEYEKTWRLFLKKNTTPSQINLLTVEIFPALLLLKDLDKMNYIISNYYEDILTLYNWSGYHMLATTLMAMTISAVKDNKIKEANINFSFIDPSKFSLAYADYITLFYLIVKYKLSVANANAKNELIAIENEYISLVKKTGFNRFSLDFLRQY